MEHLDVVCVVSTVRVSARQEMEIVGDTVDALQRTMGRIATNQPTQGTAHLQGMEEGVRKTCAILLQHKVDFLLLVVHFAMHDLCQSVTLQKL